MLVKNTIVSNEFNAVCSHVFLYATLTEESKKTESKYWPFIRTLRMPLMTKRVTHELQGTFVAELQRQFEKELQSFWWFLDGQCQHDFEQRCLGFNHRHTRRLRFCSFFKLSASTIKLLTLALLVSKMGSFHRPALRRYGV